MKYMRDALVAANLTTPTLARVDYAFTAAPVDTYDKDTPAAFVMVLEDKPQPNSSLQCVRQQTDTICAVHVVCKADQLAGAVDFVRAALLGTKPQIPSAPDRVYGMLELIGGGVDPRDGIQGDYIWWLERYSARYVVRSK